MEELTTPVTFEQVTETSPIKMLESNNDDNA